MAYQDLVDSFVYRQPLLRTKCDALAENDLFVKDNGWQTGTKATFYQATVPTGWTQDTTHNDRYLRVVGPTAGGLTGGSHTPSTDISLAHVHTLTGDSNHTHLLQAHVHEIIQRTPARQSNTNDWIVGAGDNDLRIWDNFAPTTAVNPIRNRTVNSVVDETATSSAGSHNHTLNSALTNTKFAYVDVIIGTKDAGGGTYTDLTTYFSTGTKIDYNEFDELADNDAFNLARQMPTNTVMHFGQASAPAGWQRLFNQNNKALRVVNGTGGGVGGTEPMSTGIPLVHTHTMDAQGAHTHISSTHRHILDVSTSRNLQLNPASQGYYVATNGSSSMKVTDGAAVSRTIARGRTNLSGSGVTSSSAGLHTHSMGSPSGSIVLAYFDLIECQKLGTGAPQAYTDLTAGVFAFKKLVSKQRLNNLAKNDAYLNYHIPEIGTRTFFMNATPPLNWVKLTTQNDRALRVVSGGSGGTAGGGAQSISSPIPIAHTHAINSESHTHSILHTHVIDTRTEANAGNDKLIAGLIKYALLQFESGSNYVGRAGNNGSTLLGMGQDFTNATAITNSYAHTHGGVSSSALTNITFAYLDMIYCEKG